MLLKALPLIYLDSAGAQPQQIQLFLSTQQQSFFCLSLLYIQLSCSLTPVFILHPYLGIGHLLKSMLSFISNKWMFIFLEHFLSKLKCWVCGIFPTFPLLSSGSPFLFLFFSYVPIKKKNSAGLLKFTNFISEIFTLLLKPSRVFHSLVNVYSGFKYEALSIWVHIQLFLLGSVRETLPQRLNVVLHQSTDFFALDICKIPIR